MLREMLESIERGKRLLERHGARLALQLMYRFPGAACISVNEPVAHGMSGPRVMEPGGVVNLNVSAELDGYFADTGGTHVVPPSTPTKDRL